MAEVRSMAALEERRGATPGWIRAAAFAAAVVTACAGAADIYSARPRGFLALPAALFIFCGLLLDGRVDVDSPPARLLRMAVILSGGAYFCLCVAPLL